MNIILTEFNGSIERVLNNFYLSFLAINFVNQRPFNNSIILPINLSNNVMTALYLNSFDQDGINEYGGSRRRQFLNDLVIVYERYSVLMIASHQNGQTFKEPVAINNRNLGANNFEKLADLYTPDEITFLT